MATPPETKRMHGLRLPIASLLLVLLGVGLGALLFGRGPSAQQQTHQDETADTPKSESDVEQRWTCSMHPSVAQHEPGACPLCGMDLVPAVATSGQGASMARVVLSKRAQALAKLRTSVVKHRAEAAAAVRLLGRIEANEATLRTITSWTAGRIDRLYVNETGQRIYAGQKVAHFYSPEVLAAHQDLIVAQRQVKRLSGSPDSVQAATQSALTASRERLLLLGVPKSQLARMLEQASPARSVAIHSPFSGTVIERLATQGSYVATGTPLYRIANLTSLWIQLDAYESDLPSINKGQVVRVRVRALPGEEFEGTVTFIDPTLDDTKRTARVRVQVENRDRRLRPGMFAEATVTGDAPEGVRAPLVIPASAPLFTGERAIVYIQTHTEEGHAYEPRSVRLGPRLGDYYPVVAGLSAGERIVTRGAFAIDADLQIRGGPSMMNRPSDATPASSADQSALQRAALSSQEQSQLAPVFRAYLALQRALAADSLTESKASAQQLALAARQVSLKTSTEADEVWAQAKEPLRDGASEIAVANDLEEARASFEGLSEVSIRLLQQLGNPLDEPLNFAFCPMAMGNAGAAWLQQGDKVDNAYFGAAMRTCGEVGHSVAPGDYLAPGALDAARSGGSHGH